MKAVSVRYNISEATYCAWKRKYGGVDESEANRLRALEEENAGLKRLVADLSVQNQISKEVNAKNGEPVDQAAGRTTKRGRQAGIHHSLRNVFSMQKETQKPHSENTEFIQIREAAEWLGVPFSSLREYVFRGLLPSYKLDRNRLF